MLKASHQTNLRVVAIGIGNDTDDEELETIASEPAVLNVIRVPDFSDLVQVENRLKTLSCTGQ